MCILRFDYKRYCTVLVLGLLVIAVLVPSLVVTPVSAIDEWWHTDWKHRIKITFNNTAIKENLTNFPMPIVFTSNQSNFWDHVKGDDSDIRFIDADDSTELYFELEHWNSTSQDMVAWTKVPQVEALSSTDYVWIYYGNNEADFDSYYKSSQVWSPDYRAVWHFNQTSGTIYDSTSNSNDATNSGADSTGWGKIGNAYDFEKNNDDSMYVSDSISLDITTNLTIEAWVKPESFDTFNYILEKHGCDPSSCNDEDAYAFLYENDDKLAFEAKVATDGYMYWSTNTSDIFSIGTWHYIVTVWNYRSSELKFYKDGSELGNSSITTGDLLTTDWGAHVGRQTDLYPLNHDGIMDELRVSAKVHSAEWIAACYQYQVDQSKIQIRSEETFQPAKLCVDPQVVEKSFDDVCTTFQVNITVENVTDLFAFDFNLTWDSGMISLVDVDINTTLDSIWGSGSWYPAKNKTGPGYYTLATVSLSTGFNTIQPVSLVILTFHVEDATSGETPLHFDTAKLSNSKWQSIPVEAADGLYRFTIETRLYVNPSVVEKVPSDVCTSWEANITIEDVADLFGFDFNLTWNSNLIGLVDVQYNSTLDAMWGKGNWEVAMDLSGAGWYKLVALSTSSGFNTTHTQTVVRLTFHVESFRNWEAETPLHFAVAKLSDSNWQPISAAIEDGTYRITGQKPTLKISPDTVTCRKYLENFTITIGVSDVYNLKDFKFEIHHNTTLLDYANVTWDAWGTGNVAIDEANGNITGYTSGTLKTGNLTLITTTFHAAHYHVWKDCQNWTSNLTGTIYIQWANLSYPDIADLRYERDGLEEIDVDPVEVVYTFMPIQGDVDNDGDVDIFDLRTVAIYYDQTAPTEYDLNCDGIIDIYDLVKIAANYHFAYP